jgi:DMSO/TMAO reductase YedYZ molybdopterin-dependent catalytic subunit
MESDFHSPLHDERVAARLGVWLGAAFLICFLTGLVSHYEQHPVGWLPLGPYPVWGYRLTQGVHVTTGLASVPLLLAKLYSAYPRLFAQPPVRGLLHALERASLGLLVASALFEVSTGVLNIAQWYPFHFYFPTAHHAVAWVAMGSLAVHIAAKLPVTQRALTRPLADGDAEPDRFGADPSGRTRRSFLYGVGAAAAGVVVLSVGQTVRPLRYIAILSGRRPGLGPQGLPINRTSAAAGVITTATSSGWALELVGPKGTQLLTRPQLAAMPRHEADLPIACVEGWSSGTTWGGVRIRDLVRAAGGDHTSTVRVESLEQVGVYRHSTLPPSFASHPDTLLALDIKGQALHLEHGFPARIIAPNRPGVLQTKWVAKITVSEPGSS